MIVSDAIVDRIDALFANGRSTVGPLHRDEFTTLMTANGDVPLFMANFLRFRQRAEYSDGSDGGLTGREAHSRYEEALPIIREMGGRQLFSGDVESKLLGDVMWDRVVVNWYPSRTAFLDLLLQDGYQELTVHRRAAVEAAIVLMCRRIELQTLPDPDPVSVPHSATDDDRTFTMVHLLAFNESARYAGDGDDQSSGEEAMRRYEENAAVTALPLGVRPKL